VRRVRTLGIMTAMEEEFRLLAKRFGASSSRSVGPRTFFTAHAGALAVVVVCSRIGKVAAASTATTLLDIFGVDAIVCTGVAGGVTQGVSVGDFVVSEHLVQHDFDSKGVLGCSRFEIPLLGLSRIPVDSDLHTDAALAAEAVVGDSDYRAAVSKFVRGAPRVHRGIIASGDVFINAQKEREALVRDIPGLLCVEMEGAAVAQVCVEREVSCVVARIISDGADDASHVNFNAFIQDAAAIGSEKFVVNFIANLQEE